MMNLAAKIATGASAAVVFVGLPALTAPAIVPFLPHQAQTALAGTIHTTPGTVDDLFRRTRLGDQRDAADTHITHAQVDEEYRIAATPAPDAD